MTPFSRAWFEDRLGVAVRSAGPRYTPQAHVTLPINRFFSWLGRTKAFRDEWDKLFEEYEKEVVNSYVFGRMVKHGLMKKARAEHIEARLKNIAEAVRTLTYVRFRPIRYSDLSRQAEATRRLLDPIEKQLEDLRTKARDDAKKAPEPAPPPTSAAEPPLKESDFEGLIHHLRKVDSILQTALKLADETRGSISGEASLALLSNHPSVLLVGEPGIGKTHLLCDLAGERLRSGYPTVLVLAHQLMGMTDPLQAVIRRLGLTMKNQDFLGALDALAKRRGKRALIIVDAINEGDRVVWRRTIRVLVEQCRAFDGVGLVLSCRSPFHLMMVPKRTRIGLLGHQGFREREVEALKTYFKHYNLPLPEVPLLSGEFSNPLFLKIFCESLEDAVIKKKHARIRHIASGQEGMLNIFEDFVIKRARQTATKCGLQPLAVWKMLKEGIAATMAQQGRTHLTLTEAHAVFRASGIQAGQDRAFTRELSNEGLLFEDVVFDASTRKGTEVIRLPYQKFSDHLIARYLLKSLDNKDPAKSLAPGTPLGDLVAPKKGYPRYDSVVEALLIEFPERVNQRELIDFLPGLDEDLARLFLNGLLWRKPSSFGKATAKYINRILGHEPLTREALSSLLGLATKPKHPFGAKCLDRYLRGMPLAERDLHWSESFRYHDEESVSSRLLGWLETCDANKLTPEYGEVYITVLRWFLTTTNHYFRDRAARGLYIIGRRYPELLFGSTLESLSLNDPYIPERMIAASYGVVMALQFGTGSPAFQAGPLATYARALFDQMFKKGATFSTTHILMRDYARHSIEAALLHNPRLLSAREIRLIRPPFKFGGIRRWGRSGNRDKARGSPGSPIHGNFLNYTLGTLVRDRNNYDFKNPGHVRVVQNIYWRLYQLGYDYDKFEKVDKQIAEAYWRTEGGGKVDRYGKKYSWIAFFELAGHRADRGLSGRNDPTQRIPDVNIEPSFPVAPPSIQVVTENLIGRSRSPVASWIARGPKPDLRPYLRRTSIGGQRGPWVAIDGFVEQKDVSRNRSVLIFLKTLLVKKADRDRILQCLPNCKDFRHTSDRLEQTTYAFAGEIPWSDTFPFLANKERLRLGTGRTYLKRIPGSSATLADWLRSSGTASPGASKRGFLEVECEEHEEFDVEPAARNYSWEGYHTDFTEGQTVAIPTKEIASTFGLTSRPQTFDLFDGAGRKASISLDYRGKDGRRNDFLYCRQAIIERYLRAKNFDLVWVMWGERRFVHKDAMRDMVGKGPHYVQFSSLTTYDQMLRRWTFSRR